MKDDDQIRNHKRGFDFGFFLGLSLHGIFLTMWVLGMSILSSNVGYFKGRDNAMRLLLPVGLIGISQFVYLLPAFIIALRKRETEVAKGISACAVLMILLNGSCFANSSSGMTVVAIFLLVAIFVGWATKLLTK